MTRLDEFESTFRAASKHRFKHVRPEIHRVLVLTDLGSDATRRFAKDVKDYLRELGDGVTWQTAGSDAYTYVDELLALVETHRPDLVCAYRNLHGRARNFPFSLGSHVDVLSQATQTPVLILPIPTDEGRLAPTCEGTARVMVIVDHMADSDRLVSIGVRLTEKRGDLFLAHIEDETVYDRYVDVISKLPSIDTEVAQRDIKEQLLKEPHDYIESCTSALAKETLTLTVHEVVAMGHHVTRCRELVEEHGIALVVLNSKAADQRAMNRLSYPLAVELRDVPLLLL
jgi:hypothetical protein